MMRPQSLGDVYIHTIHLENVWQVFVMPSIVNKVETQSYTHKCVRNMENYLAKKALVDKKICKLEC